MPLLCCLAVAQCTKYTVHSPVHLTKFA